MSLDRLICSLPLVGGLLERLYSFFRKHTLIANIIHLSGGLALGLYIGNQSLWYIFFLIYLVGHIYGLYKGN